MDAWPQIRPALFVPQTEEQHQALVGLLDSLIDEVGKNEDHPLASLMEVVEALIESYDDTCVPKLPAK